MDLPDVFVQGDAVSRAVAVLLLAMSVASWVVIFWKGWLLRRAAASVPRAIAAYWQSPGPVDAQLRVAAFDALGLVQPFVAATAAPVAGTLAAAGDRAQQLTRTLRGALQAALRRLQFGQVLLATVGSTAPFVGLLGTVWGIYHALSGISQAGQLSIGQVAGPVGEALVMTAAGLAVAIPAVLAYNVCGRVIGGIEEALEGFARDLRDLEAGTP